ncbi:MAG: GAF domain-containing protein [Acidobacteriaceae bacterium]|jgi:PAS domain S-box-containing protein|nr:GAF domain-containing protein [Acidobacteriaceae bacterium]
MASPRAFGTRRVSGDEPQLFPPEWRESPIRTWARPVSVLAVLAVLVVLGVANVVMRARIHEVEDGVLWGARAEGVTAIEVADGSAGALAGIYKGDLLLAVSGVPVETPADVVEYQHRGQPGTTLSYTLVRLGTRQVLDVSLRSADRPFEMYFVLAAVGLFTLVVGASVRLRRPRDQATLHFFWLCVAFFGVFTFSFNGPFDRLDWTFYWGDAIATALLPPLLLHFTLVFPERPERQRQPTWMAAMYVPAVLLGVARIYVIARGAEDGPFLSRALAVLDRVEPVYLFVCASAAGAVLVRAFGEITSLTARRQLRWIAWGTVLGIGPFAVGYALPWALGFDPPLALQLTVIPLGLVPLAFASAIVRYRLRDVEVIIKRGVAYTAFFAASAVLYLALRRSVVFAVGDVADGHNSVIALLATVIIVLLTQPVREAVQNALDRVFYRDRYDYRRALVGFARDLNTDLDVIHLGQRLVSRIVETLLVDRMALMLADERMGDFRSIGDFGFTALVPRLRRSSSFIARLDGGHTVALDDPIAAAWFLAEEVEHWRDQGIEYFVPCVFEGGAIAVLALGRKSEDQPFNSEDLGLLTAVAGQVATAIENGRLYRQLRLKAEELGRMREFNDNILESLDDGLVVFGPDERIIRWNRALEHFYGVSRAEAIGRTLSDVFEVPFVEALHAATSENPRGASLFKIPLARPDGAGDGGENQLLVNVTAVPLQGRGGPGEMPGTILLVENVTDHARLEEQLQISEKMASIGLLAAGVAHEVNTPLTGISSYTQMLLEQADPNDPRTQLLEKIERQTFRAAKIVNGLLTLSRPGTPGVERTTVDLNAVITDVISLLEHQFEAGRIKLRRELSPEAVPVLAIEHQLQQVFLNLFLNARDAMPRGGWLTVLSRIDANHATIEVGDTGSGIPPEQLARIYDPFFTTKAIGRGTGLGLSISYGIVREHDGELRCDSAVGQGTRFTLTFPLETAPQLRSGSRF